MLAPAVVLALVLIGAAPSIASAVASVRQKAGIAGRVILRRKGETPLAHHPVELAIFRHGVLAGRKKGETDASGRFRFVPGKTENGLSYQVITNYQDVAYKSPPFAVPETGIGPPVRVEVFETTAKEPELLVEREHLVVRPKVGGGISVNEMIILVNPTEKTYWKPTAGLELPLPVEARDVSLEGGAGGVTGKPPGKFLTREPVRPGKTPLVWSYDLSSGVTGVKFREAVMFPTVRLSLFVEGDRFKVRSPDLVAGPPLNLRGRTYRSFEGKDLLPGRTITVNFRDRTFGRNLLLWSGLGVGFAALSGLGYLLVSKNRPFTGKGENGFGSQVGEPDAEQFSERE